MSAVSHSVFQNRDLPPSEQIAPVSHALIRKKKKSNCSGKGPDSPYHLTHGCAQVLFLGSCLKDFHFSVHPVLVKIKWKNPANRFLTIESLKSKKGILETISLNILFFLVHYARMSIVHLS